MSAVRQFNNPDDANFNADGKLRIALAGNPNCGKTTVFNGYTGARQHVGNYPGVTVDRKEGHITVGGKQVTVVDLPGTYSLTAYSMEELVARRELAAGNVQAVIDVVDSSALERNKVVTINPAAGEKFDPNLHQAISMVPAQQEANTVVSVLQKGYLIADRILRPALVTVAQPQ